MNRMKIHWGRVLLAGLAAALLGFVIGFLLYSASNGIYETYSGMAYAKQPASIGAYLVQMVAGSLVISSLFAAVYAVVRESLPGEKAWQKGIAFGVILLGLNMLPIAFNTWMQIAQPEVLILIEAANRSISLMVQAVLIAAVYQR